MIKRFSFCIATAFYIVLCGSPLSAAQVVLCVNQVDRQVYIVANERDCSSDDSRLVIIGAKMEEKKHLPPVANFRSNEDCEGVGFINEIGFDENNNGKLDTAERLTTRSSCSNPTGDVLEP